MDDPSPDPPQSVAPPAYAGPEAPDLKADRVWSGELGSDDPGVVALLDDSVVLNDGRGGAFAIGADGKKRWVLPKTLKLSAEVPAAVVISEFGYSVGPDSPDVIAAAYQSRGPRMCWSHPEICDGEGGDARPDLGIVAFSADDGTLAWSTVLEPALRTDADPEFIHYDVKIVTDAAVVVEIVPALYDKDGQPARTPLTVALDAKTGQQLWSQYGLAVDWGSGNRILARRLAAPTRSRDDKGYPELLDARTGQRIWRGKGPGRWVSGANDLNGYEVAQVQPEDGGQPEFFTLDLTTGRTVTAGDGQCVVVGRDDNGLFCAHVKREHTDRHRLASADLPGGAGQLGQHAIPQPNSLIQAGAYLWIDSGSARTTTAHDRTGAQRLKPVPGVALAVNDDWLITHEIYKFTVYRLS